MFFAKLNFESLSFEETLNMPDLFFLINIKMILLSSDRFNGVKKILE